MSAGVPLLAQLLIGGQINAHPSGEDHLPAFMQGEIPYVGRIQQR